MSTGITTQLDNDTDQWSREERFAAVRAWHEMRQSFTARLCPVDYAACERAAREQVALMRANAPEVYP